jgi:amino acid transporter
VLFILVGCLLWIVVSWATVFIVPFFAFLALLICVSRAAFSEAESRLNLPSVAPRLEQRHRRTSVTDRNQVLRRLGRRPS